MIQRFGAWLRGGQYRFVLVVGLLMLLQTAAISLVGGWATVLLGGVIILALAVFTGAYVSGNGDSR